MQRRKECDSERVRYTKGRMRRDYGKREFFDVCLSFVSTGVYLEGKRPVLRSIEGREESFVLFTYTPAFTVS